ncbi:uncharacterized protein LOC129905949 [Episyrphus balteatus]|uniref:uncharacterized protein LOC129905949 n=1 Tax=Episyrphus balteatus TaxID=286459 RepID=UPI00248577C0|nr:uncharacterized protein LOC129905949 [Episyrphus balteatus]
MLLKIRHGILEITNHPNTRKSAIIINDEIILSSGTILAPYIRPVEPNGQCASSKIIETLRNDSLVNVQEDNNDSKFLNSLNYQITFDRKGLVNQSQIFTRYSAKLLYLFSCNEVSRYIQHICSTGGQIDDTSKECFLSSFVVLSFRKTNDKEILERFISQIKNYLRFLYKAQKLDDILTICTPFGLEEFYKTIHIGKISNLINSNGSLFVLSNNLPIGCEGAAVFNDKLRLIGMIICTSFQRQNENVNLTLAASFSHILIDFMKKLGISVSSIAVPPKISSFQWERSIVVVMIDDKQCTGTLVKILNKTFVLTCSHVIEDDNSTITCRSAYGNFEANLIWKNPNFHKPFDVALLKPSSNIPNKYFVKLSPNRPHPGQMVYNAGFPFFIKFDNKHDFNPSIFQGRIIKYTPGAIMSDGCVQAGQSGGPMFDENGCIVGICVSNLKEDNVIYPNCNTAVPINDIRQTLEQYARTGDLTVLNNLVTKDSMVLNSDPMQIQSKL